MRVKYGSDTYPEIIVKSAGKTQVRYDIKETEFEEMDGTKRACYDFSYVAIEGELTRAKIIDAIITDEIGNKDVELALINNELASPGTAEYVAYQALRTHAKEVAAEVVKNLE
ncbi:hypothetical protein [Methanosarcina virus MetMV]|jgi:hypothetical protein|nr:hypothetical protein [Methanosarcina virus MetMV]